MEDVLQSFFKSPGEANMMDELTKTLKIEVEQDK